MPNSVVVGGRYFHDAENHGLEHLTATEVLAQSSNIGTYEIGLRVGESGILAQVQRLGFGQTTSINFPDETSGLLVNAANWYASDRVALPIGQVDAVPAIQVLDAYNAIANGGVFVEPKLVRAYVSANGATTATPPSATRVVLSKSADATMIKMLEQVVLDGTGTEAIIPGYTVAGKTGTATIPFPGKDKLTDSYNATFVGFAPANNPILSMIVVIQRPLNDIYGGSVSAPVFQEIMSYALHHYGIPSNGAVQKPAHGRRRHLLGRDVMQLGDILDDVSIDVATSSLEIDRVEIDSRVCGPGALFFAMPGTKKHGVAYAREAVALGAECVVGDVAVSLDAPVVVVPASQLPALLSHASATLDWPSRNPSDPGGRDGNQRQDERHDDPRVPRPRPRVERVQHRHADQRAHYACAARAVSNAGRDGGEL